MTRNVNAAHTYNVAFSDEIGHFEYCAKVGTDPLATCKRPLGADTNNPDNKGQDPDGDDVFCLPASSSLLVKIGGCTNTDGDFDGVSYNFNWPGSISNATADRLLHPTSELFTSPLTGGKNFTSMGFESDISRNESSDTAFRVDTPCQRHVANPADPHPGVGCVNPPPNSYFLPLLHHHGDLQRLHVAGGRALCPGHHQQVWWQRARGVRAHRTGQLPDRTLRDHHEASQ